MISAGSEDTMMVAQSVGALIVVAALIIVLGKFAAKLQRRSIGGQIEVQERAALTREASVALVMVQGKSLLLGITSSSVNLLAELDAAKSEDTATASDAPPAAASHAQQEQQSEPLAMQTTEPTEAVGPHAALTPEPTTAPIDVQPLEPAEVYQPTQEQERDLLNQRINDALDAASKGDSVATGSTAAPAPMEQTPTQSVFASVLASAMNETETGSDPEFERRVAQISQRLDFPDFAQLLQSTQGVDPRAVQAQERAVLPPEVQGQDYPDLASALRAVGRVKQHSSGSGGDIYAAGSGAPTATTTAAEVSVERRAFGPDQGPPSGSSDRRRRDRAQRNQDSQWSGSVLNPRNWKEGFDALRDLTERKST